MTKLQLLSIGEVMAELRRGDDDNFAVGFAGDTFNTAVYCARGLEEPNSVGYFTRIGPDPLSNDLLTLAKAERLDVSNIARDVEKMIGIYAVATDETGERSFSYWRENSAARRLFSHDESVSALPSARIIYLSGITLGILSASARQRLIDHLISLSNAGETLIAFDSNYRPKLWENQATARRIIGQMWEISDIALPSIDDEMDLFGDTTEDAVIARFSKKDWRACAIKRGVKGPLSPTLSQERAPKFVAAPKVTDTTAAGDSFNGGYLAAFLSGLSEVDCLLAGHNLASAVVGVSGAISPLR